MSRKVAAGVEIDDVLRLRDGCDNEVRTKKSEKQERHEQKMCIVVT